MHDPSIRNPAYRALTDKELSEIDELCERFDQELVKGDAPRIEEFLTDAPQAARDRLLAELLAMEVEYRTQRGDVPQRDEYIQRFPEQVGVISGVFARDAMTHYSAQGTIAIPVNVPPVMTNFRLIRELGRGGMGVVWLAEQAEPVKRRVALKLIKSELTAKDVLARFDAEKQALAMMDHPNIARVLDAGTTEDGRPFFVMELVDGIPITQYCDDNKLSVDERLKLFVPVCKAVQHAHQKGIVHRDLKPSNVLVTVIDGDAVPKVIDFGLAKAVVQNPNLSDLTMMTEFGRIVGTVQYMSPEQAELKGPNTEDIDTRTDVYSLGVMLYELLAGSTPLDKETLAQNALLKVLQIIREQDPPRPSNRLSSSSHTANSAISDLRRLHPARLQQLLRGELDWVVMKALEKDRNRRYQTANDLAQDLTNYLTGGAVAARPPSTWYQVRKFAHRNRGLVAAMLAIGVALLAGIAGTGYGLIQANQKAAEANGQRIVAENKTKEAKQERANAKASEQRALDERDKAEANKLRAVEAEGLASAESQRARDSEAVAKFQLANARWDAGRARDARDLLREIPPEYRDNFEWHFCNRQFDGSVFTCYGHSLTVRGVAFSPDGSQIATASMDSSIKLWDANSGREIETLWGHQGTVDGVVYSPDGTRIASRSSDKTIRIWDVRSGQMTATLEDHKNYIVAIAFSPDGNQLMSASSAATLTRWDVSSGQEISTLTKSESGVGVAFSPDGKRFVSYNHGAIILWDATSGQEIARQVNAVRAPTSAAFSPDGRHIAVAAHDIITLWDKDLTRNLWTADGKAGWIRGLSFSPDGTRLASGGGDRHVRVWDVRSGLEMMKLVGHAEDVPGVAFSPDGARLASVSSDTTLKVWDARTGKRSISLRAHNAKIFGIAFSSDRERFASVSADGKFKLWDVATGSVIQSVNGFYNPNAPGVGCVAISSNDEYVAFGGDDNTVKLLDGRTGGVLKSLKGHESSICTVAFSPDSRLVASGSLDHTVKLWDVDSGQEIAVFAGHTGRVNDVAFSPDGTRVVSACEDQTIKLWDVQSADEIMSLHGHAFNVADVAVSPDGKRLASSSSDHSIRLWDAQSGEAITQLKGHEAGVMGIAFSPDGKRIASTSFDRMLKLWDVPNGREICTIDTSDSSFQAVAFSPDGLRIAVGEDNGIITFFDAPTESEATPLSGHTDMVTGFSFSADGNQILSESKNEELYWDVATRTHVSHAAWEPPSPPSPISPDGRWLIHGDRKYLLLIDREFKSTPREKRFRDMKVRFEPQWHQEQAAAATAAKDWYAATFQRAVLMNHAPDRASYYDDLHSSFEELKSQWEQQQSDLEPHLALVVRESLKLARGDEPPNSSFEEPVIRQRGFEFRESIPGWQTTGELFEIWSTGFLGVKAHDSDQFVEVNARKDGTLYQDLTGIERDAEIEFTFAHRGRNGEDILKLTITDLGADGAIGGGDDTELFVKEYTTGTSAWAVYDSTTEAAITALGNKVRCAFSAVYATGGNGPDNTEGNFLDAANFGAGVVTARSKAHGNE